MTRVLVVHASRHGATKEIAERIGEVLESEGIEAPVYAGDEVEDVSADAYVIGSGVYMGHWLGEGLDFLRRNREALKMHPIWLFSSGPLPGSSRTTVHANPVEDALGPEEGRGSGGRRQLADAIALLRVREHHVFNGKFDPVEGPRAFSERVIRLTPASKDLLPPGDFRDWAEIEAWARHIAEQVRIPVFSV